ncbi:hypothetical protein [Mesorhizobium mediterraneum]|uniref:hypothetical protein n=1 Tax=Mesorhizobium mediterraneum TaxID=43617 RepID=UPI00177ACD6F|nr:hypothetical protein [Mesorhizobium mediterraneum]
MLNTVALKHSDRAVVALDGHKKHDRALGHEDAFAFVIANTDMTGDDIEQLTRQEVVPFVSDDTILSGSRQWTSYITVRGWQVAH